jgi:hypothetical protein
MKRFLPGQLRPRTTTSTSSTFTSKIDANTHFLRVPAAKRDNAHFDTSHHASTTRIANDWRTALKQRAGEYRTMPRVFRSHVRRVLTTATAIE